MGLLTGYLLYRSGRKRAERKAARKAQIEQWRLEKEMKAVICIHCGFPEFMHSPDERKLCPKF